MAFATIVVAARAGGNIKQVLPEFNAFLSEPNNSIYFAEQIITILKNPDIKAKMLKQARPSILQANWSLWLEQFEEKLYKLV
ncbi:MULTISPECIES: glycosyltransferase [Nostoc]|uniref:Glycosyltransferase n=2 Tax=Nostoc TaxID=1177 RepID=A0ABR8I8J6_9NOSO|nr:MULTISPECIES: glycosyltransferase [Nostoc]MBD2563734.1 glycosyltransferase [Nostoc linckia FACHB-391]MBD2647226.1 glycosyltransferase [Nostoc foliaceum FACHB-393]